MLIGDRQVLSELSTQVVMTSAKPASLPPMVRETRAVEELSEPQLRLVRVRGQRARAWMRIHHQQVHRVRSHVEDTESHVGNATASWSFDCLRRGFRRLTLDACQRRKR